MRSLQLVFFLQILMLLLIALLVALGAGSFFFCILLGGIGASISLMRRLYKQEDPGFKGLAFVNSVLMPVLYGVLMSGIAYLLFMSGILSGDGGGGLISSNLFPNFDHGKVTDKMSLVQQFFVIRPEDIKEAGKLLVWCFITGYSESFITGILKMLEKSTAGTA